MTVDADALKEFADAPGRGRVYDQCGSAGRLAPFSDQEVDTIARAFDGDFFTDEFTADELTIAHEFWAERARRPLREENGRHG